MRVPLLRWSLPLAAIAIILGASGAFAALRDNFTKPPPPLPGNHPVAELKMTGQDTGEFTIGGPRPDMIPVLGLDFGQANARDPDTHLATGFAFCHGLTFRKLTDRSTPQLLKAQSRHETITEASFREPNLTIVITHAIVASVHHVAAETSREYEDVTLAPGLIEFVWRRDSEMSRSDHHFCGDVTH